MAAIDLAKTPSFRLDGKRALVTGGGRGIGLAAGSALAAAGAHVTLAARTRSEIDAAAEAIRARGDQAEALQLDVTDIEAARGAIARVQRPSHRRRRPAAQRSIRPAAPSACPQGAGRAEIDVACGDRRGQVRPRWRRHARKRP